MASVTSTFEHCLKSMANKAFLSFSQIQQQHKAVHLFVAEYVALLTQLYSTESLTILTEGYNKREKNRTFTDGTLIVFECQEAKEPSSMLHMRSCAKNRDRVLLQKHADFKQPSR